jgi:hypothetical protein
MSSGSVWIMGPRSIWRLSSNLADDPLRVDLQGYEAVCDVNLSPRYTIHDSRDPGFDFSAIIQPGDHGRADLDLLAHSSFRGSYPMKARNAKQHVLAVSRFA